MNHIESYAHFVNSVFGDETISLSENSKYRNNVIGAIDTFYKTGEYDFFTSNLKQRFYRLNRKYKNDHKNFSELKNKLVGLTTRNWEGCYSELVAYDYFSLFTKVEMEVPVSSELTMASYNQRRTGSSFDGKLPELFDVAFEVKTFGDKNKKLISGIINEVCESHSSVWITADYPNDIDYQKIQENRKEIYEGIDTAIKIKQNRYQNLHTPELSFGLIYNQPHTLITEHPYTPYRQAQELKYFVLNHCDQLFLNEVNLIVYVVHPWFNLINSIDFLQNSIFFRSFSRRVFCELTKDEKLVEDVMPNKNEWRGIPVKVSDVAKRISGILFIVDNNVEPETKFQLENPLSTMESYLYINPNVDTKNKNEFFFENLAQGVAYKRLALHYDDFLYDNY